MDNFYTNDFAGNLVEMTTIKAKMKSISTQYILLKKIQVSIMKVQVRMMGKLDSDSTEKYLLSLVSTEGDRAHPYFLKAIGIKIVIHLYRYI